MAVTITSGSNGPYDMDLGGQTVGQVRRAFGQALNIGEDDQAQLNGEAVDDDETIEDGDSLDFVKTTAQKGDRA